MQTFLPWPSFAHSAACIDRQRLTKQRIESQQIMHALADSESGWQNHPATRMWRATPGALAVYSQHCLLEWIARGYQNGMHLPYDADWRPNPAYPHRQLVLPVRDVVMPAWLGNEAFHASHRSALLHKDEEWYRQFGWNDAPELNYVWPA